MEPDGPPHYDADPGLRGLAHSAGPFPRQPSRVVGRERERFLCRFTVMREGQGNLKWLVKGTLSFNLFLFIYYML